MGLNDAHEFLNLIIFCIEILKQSVWILMVLLMAHCAAV